MVGMQDRFLKLCIFWDVESSFEVDEFISNFKVFWYFVWFKDFFGYFIFSVFLLDLFREVVLFKFIDTSIDRECIVVYL